MLEITWIYNQSYKISCPSPLAGEYKWDSKKHKISKEKQQRIRLPSVPDAVGIWDICWNTWIVTNDLGHWVTSISSVSPSPPRGLAWLTVNATLIPTDARLTAPWIKTSSFRIKGWIGGEERRALLSLETREAKESQGQHRDRELSPFLFLLPRTMWIATLF